MSEDRTVMASPGLVLCHQVFLVVLAAPHWSVATTSAFSDFSLISQSVQDPFTTAISASLDGATATIPSSIIPTVFAPETASTHTPPETETVLWTSYDSELFGSASSLNATPDVTTWTADLTATINATEMVDLSETLSLPSTLMTEMADVSETVSLPSTQMALSTSDAGTTATTTTTTPRSTTTRAPKPIDDYQCKGLPPPALHATWEMVLLGDLLLYTCRPGFRQIGGNRWLTCGAVYGWLPKQGMIECEEIRWERTKEVPSWPMTLLNVLKWLLVAALVYLVLLGLLLCCLRFFRNMQSPLVQTATAKPPTSVKKGNSRRWPWKRPPRPRNPPGHLGPDGVAWIVNRDNMAFPLKQ